MFGDLFNEDATGCGETFSSANLIPLPPAPRLDCKLAGIDNQGATCYLNSLLQTLLLTPEFREKLFELTEVHLGDLQNKDNQNAKIRVIPLQLQRLFSQLLLSNQQSVSTADLTNSFGWTNQEEFQQHDVQELNRILFSAIEESLVGTPGQHIIHELYHGVIVNKITCSKCKRSSEREEVYQDLTLSISGISDLNAALKLCYCDVEVMDGKNQYRCERCCAYTDATKGAQLRKLPPILTISLLRFSFDLVKMTRYKENGRFTFPLELDMSPYSEEDSSSKEENLYELFSVVVHRGGAYGGHYFAYIRDLDDLGHWKPQEEGCGVRQKADPNATGLDVIECQSPVDLIENILGQASHNCMSVDKLCAEISKVTGVSWNKRFKKVHGPINKFLKGCDSFDYNPDSNWVSLRSPGTGGSSVDPELHGEEQTQRESTVPNAQHVDTTSTKKAQPDVPEQGHRWFCFNDSRVSPIHAKDIEKQFSGKESAYMLFYRVKTLHRPEEAKGNPSYKIPGSIIKEVEELNYSVEAQRQQYEEMVNKISLNVYIEEDFTYNGLLWPKPSAWEVPGHFVIEMDKRKTLSELRARIREVLESMPDDKVNNFVIHRMKSCCGGYHLHEELCDEDAVLETLGLTDGVKLFVWNGSVMNNEVVEFGAEVEPILLTVRDASVDTLIAKVVLAKHKSLSQLYQDVAEATELDIDGLKLCQLTQVGAHGSKNLKDLPSSPETSLAAAGLNNGDVLVVVVTDSQKWDENDSHSLLEQHDVNGSSVDDSEWTVTFQNRLLGNDNHSTCKTVSVCTRSSMTIKNLKSQALNSLQLQHISPETVRLREDHKTMGLQPPLREGLCLMDAGLSSNSCIVLESGRPPLDSEMTVCINKVIHGKLVSRREFLVDRQLSVLGMLQAACHLMSCEGSQWYLSKTDVYGDPADALSSDESTLMDVLINDGDTLILQQGTVVKKDEVCLTIWLSTDTDSELGSITSSGDVSDCSDPALHQEEEDKVMLELAARLSVKDHVPAEDLNPLNNRLFPKLEQMFDNSLVIPKSSSIEELKQALMSTEKFQTMRVPTSNFMRLRVVEGSRLRAVLRNNSQILRHANSKDTVNLAVQVLRSEECLSIHEVLLLVAQKIGGSRIYMPAKEFIWNTSGGVGAGDLRRAIAMRYSLPLHDMLIAKYNTDTWEWTVLRDVPQKSSKNKGKKKGANKVNIRQGPYHVQDGDLIGVKLLSSDKGYLEIGDFSTQEDIEKRQLLQQIAEEKKKMREDKKRMLALDGVPARHRPEVALTIKVDKFS